MQMYVWELENSNEPVEVLKTVEAYHAYQQMLRYYAVKTLSDYCIAHEITISEFQQTHEAVLEPWLNIGGQLVPTHRFEALRDGLKEGSITSWDEVHDVYAYWFSLYEEDRAMHALATLHAVLGCHGINEGQWEQVVDEVAAIRIEIENQVFKTKEKDFNNRFRFSTYRTVEERNAVLGSLDDNPFIQESKQITEQVLSQIRLVRFS